MTERIDRLLSILDQILKNVVNGKLLYRARFVACIAGQIISMMAVFGSIVRLKTRELYKCIFLRSSWNSLVAVTAPAIDELYFGSKLLQV